MAPLRDNKIQDAEIVVKIRLDNVNMVFKPNVQALKDVDLEINDKEFLVLVGPSGCGKSTCLNIIAGLEFATSGKVWFDDQDVTFVTPKDRKVAMVFQSYALYPHMNVRDNMSFALKLAKVDKKVIEERVNKAAEILEISNLLNRKPKELSGGQRQRVALGRCIVRNPTVFLFDEPLSNLDAKLRTEMRGEIIKLQHRLKTTLVYVTHDQIEAMSMAHRIAILNEGKLQQVGTPHDVYHNPINQFVASFIGSPTMNFIQTSLIEKNGFYLEFDGLKYPIPNQIAKRLVNRSSDNIVLGIRPEQVEITPEERAGSYKTTISVIEYLGAETLVTCDVSPNRSILIVTKGSYPGNMGDTAYISFQPNQIFLFDGTTKQNLLFNESATKTDITHGGGDRSIPVDTV